MWTLFQLRNAEWSQLLGVLCLCAHCFYTVSSSNLYARTTVCSLRTTSVLVCSPCPWALTAYLLPLVLLCSGLGTLAEARVVLISCRKLQGQSSKEWGGRVAERNIPGTLHQRRFALNSFQPRADFVEQGAVTQLAPATVPCHGASVSHFSATILCNHKSSEARPAVCVVPSLCLSEPNTRADIDSDLSDAEA